MMGGEQTVRPEQPMLKNKIYKNEQLKKLIIGRRRAINFKALPEFPWYVQKFRSLTVTVRSLSVATMHPNRDR